MRTPDHPINPLIAKRWSPRAMSGEPLSDLEILSLFEAARWAPSSSNSQPWRFLYAKRDTPYWNTFFSLLVPFNQKWCGKAGLLCVVAAAKFYKEKPSRTSQFDTGSAWENIALEGTSRGLVIHGMEGFDYERAQRELRIPPDYEVLAMFAAGKPAPKETLPPDLLEREVPSGRKNVEELIFEGFWK